MSKSWIPDEKGNHIEIPKELFPSIRKLIKDYKNQQKITFLPIPKGQGFKFDSK
jgi:hypothetical protein